MVEIFPQMRALKSITSHMIYNLAYTFKNLQTTTTKMKTYCVPNKDCEQKDVILVKNFIILNHKKLSFDDFLMTTWESQNK